MEMTLIFHFPLSILHFFATLRQHVSQITLAQTGKQARIPEKEQHCKRTQSPEPSPCTGEKAGGGEYEEVEIGRLAIGC